MKLGVDFSQLSALASSFNAKTIDFWVPTESELFQPIDEQLTEGLEIPLDDIEDVGNLLSYRGRQVLLYIKDHSGRFDETLQNPEQGKRFHIAHCRTLDDMRRRNRFERYVATNNLTGIFRIEDAGRYSSSREADAELCVCMNCLSRLNYQGSARSNSVRKKNFKTFSISQFFSQYSSCFRYMPKAWAEQVKVGYTKDWPEISARVRRAANFICYQCEVDLSDEPGLCHVHHQNGVKSDNSSSNLRVLCVDCHRREPGHEGMFVRREEMQRINELRRKSGVIPTDDWKEVYDLVDPAIIGDLDLLRFKKSMPPPEVGYEVTNDQGAVIAEFEVAWPERKIAIVIEKLDVSGWKIYGLGELCKLL